MITQDYYVDAHIHIGKTLSGKSVKISAAPSLTVHGILDEALMRKGIDIVGIIDAVCPPVYEEIVGLIERGELASHHEGGLIYRDQVTLLLGGEIEVRGPHGGAAHFGIFVPDLVALREVMSWLASRQTNPSLSSQRLQSGDAFNLAKLTKDVDGIFIVNHAFTPHKGLFGSCVEQMSDMVSPDLVTAVELGLSADTEMADRISQLATLSFVTNSDAHSLPKIAREYHSVALTSPSFAAYKRALLRTGDDRITKNVGLWPRLGKYHRTMCLACGEQADEPTRICKKCGSQRVTMGVWDRLIEVADCQESVSPPFRPPYIHQIPLEFIPGLGKQKLKRLMDAFGLEMTILNEVSTKDLISVLGEDLGILVDRARSGQLALESGAGGRYGRLILS